MVNDDGEGKYDDVEGGMRVDDGGEEGGGGRSLFSMRLIHRKW